MDKIYMIRVAQVQLVSKRGIIWNGLTTIYLQLKDEV